MSNPSKLIVLDKAHSLLQDLNEAVERMRKPHLADLKKQLIKTAVSIVSNIAEGRRRESQREFLNFLNIALGSTGELETKLRAANDCHALPASTHDELAKRAEEVGKMLSGLKRRIMEDLNGEES
jgi:four helix bundle protein